MSKKGRPKFRFRWIHLQAVLVLILYNIISKANLAHALIRNTFLVSFLQVYGFGILATFAFLYLFSHEDFFTFARELERNEERGEKKYLYKFKHLGKLFATFLIGSIGGPIFLALTLRIFFHKHSVKYLLIFLVIFISTLFGFGLLKGSINLL